MIGVVCPEADLPVAEELFELFKTPWAPFDPERSYDVVVADGSAPETDASLAVVFVDGPGAAGRTLHAGQLALPIYGRLHKVGGAAVARTDRGEAVVDREDTGSTTTIRCGYSLFAEARYLLTDGQPAEHAAQPTLDLHLELLRRWMIDAGVSFVEVPPRPARGRFVATLTHDIDFLRLRDHRFDHTLAGFLSRATVGSIRDGIRGRRPLREVGRNLGAAAATPLVQLGLRPDPWRPFESYLAADSPHRSTFFVVPFAGRPGRDVSAPNPGRRAVRYELEEARPSLERAAAAGCEIGLHGIDAWLDAEAARAERERIEAVCGSAPEGVRMHWLCRRPETPQALEEAGFAYDATVGYNDAVGFRAGTLQPYRPLGCSRLLELPLHLQDTSLFYPGRLALGRPDAWAAVRGLLGQARAHGGALTVSWHDRSLAPERLWGEFYAELLETLAASEATFLTAREAVSLFRTRRALEFSADGMAAVRIDGAPEAADLLVRIHRPSRDPVEEPCRSDHVVELGVAAARGS